MSNKELKAEVMDLLNQIVIKTQGIEEPDNHGKEDYDGYPISFLELINNPEDYFEDEDEKELLEKYQKMPKKEKEALETQVYLANVHAMAKRVVDGDVHAAAYNEKQYYNSNC